MGWREFDPVGDWASVLAATTAGIVVVVLLGGAVLSLFPANSCACSPPPPTEHVDPSAFALDRVDGTPTLTAHEVPPENAGEVFVRVNGTARTWADLADVADNATLAEGDAVVLTNATAGEQVRVTYRDFPERAWEGKVPARSTASATA